MKIPIRGRRQYMKGATEFMEDTAQNRGIISNKSGSNLITFDLEQYPMVDSSHLMS
ncbi:MAG: hypothetical protein JSW35_10825 [Deltaproteobacteria bacterium]|nr:MAG: hypothetical protein JSW35_10825 [Deltaproteobacteria bacterium]